MLIFSMGGKKDENLTACNCYLYNIADDLHTIIKFLSFMIKAL